MNSRKGIENIENTLSEIFPNTIKHNDRITESFENVQTGGSIKTSQSEETFQFYDDATGKIETIRDPKLMEEVDESKLYKKCNTENFSVTPNKWYIRALNSRFVNFIPTMFVKYCMPERYKFYQKKYYNESIYVSWSIIKMEVKLEYKRLKEKILDTYEKRKVDKKFDEEKKDNEIMHKSCIEDLMKRDPTWALAQNYNPEDLKFKDKEGNYGIYIDQDVERVREKVIESIYEQKSDINEFDALCGHSNLMPSCYRHDRKLTEEEKKEAVEAADQVRNRAIDMALGVMQKAN